MNESEKTLIRLAHESGDKLLLKLCMNLVNRNARLTETNAELLLGVAPPEWGDTAIWKRRTQKLAKLTRQLANQTNQAMMRLPDNKAGKNLRRKVNQRMNAIENFYDYHDMPPLFKGERITTINGDK